MWQKMLQKLAPVRSSKFDSYESNHDVDCWENRS